MSSTITSLDLILSNSTFLAPFLVYPVAAGDTPPYERIAWWKIIFSYLGYNLVYLNAVYCEMSRS